MKSNFLIIILFSFLPCFYFAQKNTTIKNVKNKQDQEKKYFLQQHKPSAIDFHAIGHSLFFDLNLSPIQTYAADSTTYADTLTTYSRIAQYSFYHICYHFRLNLFNIDDDNAISLSLSPGIGLGSSQSKKINGFGALTGAAQLGYEWGIGSTYRSAADKGGCVKIGVEYSYSPITIQSHKTAERDIRSWLNPVLSFGFRKENNREKLIENNFKIGFGLQKANQLIGVNPYSIGRSFSFRYSFIVYLDH